MIFDKINIIESSDTNVFKYVFENDTAVAEAVLYKYPTFEERTVICCSTQSGCPVGCRFCGAGDYFVRSLTGKEIVAQVKYCLESKNINATSIQRFQIMFMSMGEPMLNPTGLTYAIKELAKLYPNAKLLVSTSAPDVDYTAFTNLSVDYPQVGLQFSVHESTNEARNKLIPFKKKLTLESIAATGHYWWGFTDRKPFFNYCAQSHNTSDADVERLYSLFDPKFWECTISVVCERDEHVAAANIRQEALAKDFMTKMVNKGYSTRMFNPAGQDDIGGGCGQLWFVQDWMKANPKLARPSCGINLIKVHTPQEIS